MHSVGEQKKLAALYDWHNSIRLDTQNNDINFWRSTVGSNNRVLILGAGTGRIAMPISNSNNWIVALDRNLFRLSRIAPSDRLMRVCGDFRALPLRGVFRHIIFPYSTFQLIPHVDIAHVLRQAAGVLSENGSVWIDVSNNFGRRNEHAWKTVMVGHCAELRCMIEEKQKAELGEDHLALEIRYFSGDKLIAGEVEQWYLHNTHLYEESFAKAGLRINSIRTGYNRANCNTHRVIYQLGL